MKTGDYLVNLTDELEGFGSCSYIEEFVSGSPKNHAFSVFCHSSGKRTSRCKVRGITFNYENSKVINFTSLSHMILGDTPLHVNNSKKIKRKDGGVVVSEPESKEYKVLFKKRRRTHNFVSFPYGYQ
jgi:hypothetical protein